jgi:hypothetical protein
VVRVRELDDHTARPNFPDQARELDLHLHPANAARAGTWSQRRPQSSGRLGDSA